MALLPAHLESMQSWLDLAEEVVVVDSLSTDGTLELLRKRLTHPRVRLLTHPPGLYESWNFGLAQMRARYAYISTVGDSITRCGLEHLCTVARDLRCDLVVSKPSFVDLQGRHLPPPRWPIDDICETLRVKETAAVEGVVLFLFALVNYTDAILGSSASNLYRTECLQRRPFRTDFGTVGDGAWGLQNALDVRLGLTKQVCSVFRHHPKSYGLARYAVPQLAEKLYTLGVVVHRDRITQNRELRAETERLRFAQILALAGKHAVAQRRLEGFRRSRWPWSMNPAAWLARLERDRAFRHMHVLKRAAVKALRTELLNSSDTCSK